MATILKGNKEHLFVSFVLLFSYRIHGTFYTHHVEFILKCVTREYMAWNVIVTAFYIKEGFRF